MKSNKPVLNSFGAINKLKNHFFYIDIPVFHNISVLSTDLVDGSTNSVDFLGKLVSAKYKSNFC